MRDVIVKRYKERLEALFDKAEVELTELTYRSGDTSGAFPNDAENLEENHA